MRAAYLSTLLEVTELLCIVCELDADALFAPGAIGVRGEEENGFRGLAEEEVLLMPVPVR